MKKITPLTLILVAILALAMNSSAQQRYDIADLQATTVTNGASVTVTNTLGDINGDIVWVGLDLVTAGTTADVIIATAPATSTTTGQPIFVGSALAADVSLQPGQLLMEADNTVFSTNYTPEVGRIPVVGRLIMTVSGASASGRVINARVIYQKR